MPTTVHAHRDGGRTGQPSTSGDRAEGWTEEALFAQVLNLGLSSPEMVETQRHVRSGRIGLAHYTAMWGAKVRDAEADFEALIHPTREPPASGSDSEEEAGAAPARGSSEEPRRGTPAAAVPEEPAESDAEDWNFLSAFQPKATAG